MERTSDTLFWLRTVAYLTVAGVAVSLVLQEADHLPLLLAGISLFAIILPIWPWIRRLGPGPYFLLVTAEAFLVTVGQFLSGEPGTVMLLFFVLLPSCARLPRRFSLLCYTGFPFLACLPYLLGSDPRAGWSGVASVVPGFLASIAFAEGYWTLRGALEAKQKLMDELVAAQRQLEGGATTLPPGAAGPGPAEVLTRRDKEVLELVAMGFSNKEIAEKLFLAEGTVKNRVSLLLDKIGARDRTQAALKARDWGVI